MQVLCTVSALVTSIAGAGSTTKAPQKYWLNIFIDPKSISRARHCSWRAGNERGRTAFAHKLIANVFYVQCDHGGPSRYLEV